MGKPISPEEIRCVINQQSNVIFNEIIKLAKDAGKEIVPSISLMEFYVARRKN